MLHPFQSSSSGGYCPTLLLGDLLGMCIKRPLSPSLPDTEPSGLGTISGVKSKTVECTDEAREWGCLEGVLGVER